MRRGPRNRTQEGDRITGKLWRTPFVRPAPEMEAAARTVAATDEVAINDSCFTERVGDPGLFARDAGGPAGLAESAEE